MTAAFNPYELLGLEAYDADGKPPSEADIKKVTCSHSLSGRGGAAALQLNRTTQVCILTQFEWTMGAETPVGRLQAFKKLSLVKHPDKQPDNPNAGQEFDLIKQARDVLLDPAAREAADAVLRCVLNDQHTTAPQNI